MKTAIRNTILVIISVIVMGIVAIVAFVGCACLEQYRLDGVSKYLRYDDDQTVKTFTKYNEIEGVTIYSYGVEDLWFQTFDAEGISFEDYINKPNMTLKRLLSGYESKNITEDIEEYNLDGDPLIKFVKYQNNLIAIDFREDSQEVVKLFLKEKKYLINLVKSQFG